jgi:hypothetical protein
MFSCFATCQCGGGAIPVFKGDRRAPRRDRDVAEALLPRPADTPPIHAAAAVLGLSAPAGLLEREGRCHSSVPALPVHCHSNSAAISAQLASRGARRAGHGGDEEGRGAVQLHPLVATGGAASEDEVDGLADEGLGRAEGEGLQRRGLRGRGDAREEGGASTGIEDRRLAGLRESCAGREAWVTRGAGRGAGVRGALVSTGSAMVMWTGMRTVAAVDPWVLTDLSTPWHSVA